MWGANAGPGPATALTLPEVTETRNHVQHHSSEKRCPLTVDIIYNFGHPLYELARDVKENELFAVRHSTATALSEDASASPRHLSLINVCLLRAQKVWIMQLRFAWGRRTIVKFQWILPLFS